MMKTSYFIGKIRRFNGFCEEVSEKIGLKSGEREDYELNDLTNAS